MSEPAAPEREARERALDVLAEFVAKGGAGTFLLAPVDPGEAAFPEPWAATKAGVALLLRRLAWHAGIDRAIEIEDRRVGAPPTERKPATAVELIEVRKKSAVFVLRFLGEDDIVGTLAHEIGVVHAVLHRPDGTDPYRTAEAPVISVDPDVDLERGSIAAVYLGLGVLAANAARQVHSVLEGQSFHPLIVASVGVKVEAGHVPVEWLGYLLAVQGIVRGDAQPPPGLAPAQRREVEAWMATLNGRAAELRARLGIAEDARAGARPRVEPFGDAVLEADPIPRAIAFRWRTHRGGVGLIAGTLFGIGLATALASRAVAPAAIIGGAIGGHLFGRRVRVPRCSACSTVVRVEATSCHRCGAALKGDISHLSDRLEAEERLEDPGP
jgi:hypothetical protein